MDAGAIQRRQNAVRRRQFRRAVEYVINHNFHFYIAFIVNLLGIELLRRIFQEFEIQNARHSEGAIELWANGRHYAGREQVLEFVAERIAATFPTWLGRLIQFFTTYGVANLMALIVEIVVEMFFEDDDDDDIQGFVPFFPPPQPPPQPPPPPPPPMPRGPEQAEGGNRRGGSLKMTDPRNTPEPAWVKEILRE
jgi:hypothetical protein